MELNQTTVDNLVAGIAANIDYAFEFRWRPRWLKDGDAHRWTEGSESDEPRHFVECLACKRITVHACVDEATAWYVTHTEDDDA